MTAKTVKQQRVLEFIRRYLVSNGESPTIKEIGQFFQMGSPASVHRILGDLESQGLIKRVANVSRGIRLFI